jgi:hypothetical protein
MTPGELADELGISPKTLRAWLRRKWPRDEPGAAWTLTSEQVAAARQNWAGTVSDAPQRSAARGSGSRVGSDEDYVLDLLDELLGTQASRQHRFDWLLGDPGQTGRRVRLPVDGYWPSRALIVEYRERQHDEPVSHFDKPDRLTVSGIHRGEQRRLYDERRDTLVPEHGLTLLVIKPADLDADPRGRLRRNRELDFDVLRKLLHSAGV